PLGPILKLEEDDFGLKYTAKISKTSYGNDIYELIKDGSITEHSVGFQTIKQKKDKDGVNRITEVKMWEGSLVVWGANASTPLTSVKTMPELYDELEFLNKQIRKGEINDLTLLTLKLEQLKQTIENLTPTNEQSVKETTEQLETWPSELELLKLFKDNLTFLKK
ncbi:MAG: HK97 family phage prohead protease, partial [Candidatus Heimdallarchaeota archaeon]